MDVVCLIYPVPLESPAATSSYQHSASQVTFAKVRHLFGNMRLTDNAMPVRDTYSTFLSQNYNAPDNCNQR